MVQTRSAVRISPEEIVTLFGWESVKYVDSD